jgi:hypothetical protein
VEEHNTRTVGDNLAYATSERDSRQAVTVLAVSAVPGLANPVPAPSALPLLSYQVSSLKQDDHELRGLQFGLQFTAVRPSSPGYARRV